MNIGILTFHRAYNYGARLQCYALTKYLQSLGHSVKVIDYYPDYFKEEYALIPIKKINKAGFLSKISILIESLLFLPLKIIRRRRFDRFLYRLPLSERLPSSAKQYGNYDIVFVGSDQVWNKQITGDCVDPFYTGVVKRKGIKLVAYAASTKVDSAAIDTLFYKQILKNFERVSVREDIFCDICNKLISGCALTVVDPVLLLKKKEWEKISVKPRETNYLLVYTVPSDASVMKFAKLVAESRRLKIIELVPNIKYLFRRNARQIASPEEFIGYFLNASYIVTTSFHGTAFSIIFEKQFSTILLGSSVDDRSLSLLNKLGLGTRTVTSSSITLPKTEIDYGKINSRLDAIEQISYQYIKESIT